MTEFNLTKYYNNEEKLGPQGGGWAEPSMTVQQIAHEIYTSHQEMGTLKQWREDPRYNELHTIAKSKVFNIINNFIRQDYF